MNRAHVCVVQPPGYVHALVLADPAQYLRHRLETAGVPTTLSANRLRRDAVNFVFGAHNGFDPAWCEQFRVVVVNLEQLGAGGARLSPQYLDLLKNGQVVDYDAGNAPAYGQSPSEVALLTVGHAPYLAAGQHVPFADRPIDVLFVGSINDHRRDVLGRIAATGASVTVFDAPVYGAERDEVVRHARCVVNIPYYATSRFEQVRASVVMSCGTPLLSERRGDLADVPECYRDTVVWFDADRPEELFPDVLRSPGFAADVERRIEAFRQAPVLPDVEAIWARFGADATEPATVVRPRLLTVDTWRDGYRPGWLNAGPAWSDPDVVVADGVVPGPAVDTGRWGGLDLAGSLDVVRLGRVEDLSVAGLGDALAAAGRVLVEDGVVVLEWPVSARAGRLQEAVLRAWTADPAYRFAIAHRGRIDDEGRPCPDGQTPTWLRIVLRKGRVSSAEATVTTALRPDLGAGLLG